MREGAPCVSSWRAQARRARWKLGCGTAPSLLHRGLERGNASFLARRLRARRVLRSSSRQSEPRRVLWQQSRWRSRCTRVRGIRGAQVQTVRDALVVSPSVYLLLPVPFSSASLLLSSADPEHCACRVSLKLHGSSCMVPCMRMHPHLKCPELSRVHWRLGATLSSLCDQMCRAAGELESSLSPVTTAAAESGACAGELAQAHAPWAVRGVIGGSGGEM